MGIFKYKGAFKAEVYMNGKRVDSQYGFETKSKAKLWMDTQKVLFNQKPDLLEKKKAIKTTFDDLLRYFESNHLPTIKKGTSTRYLLDIKQRIEPYFRHMKLDEIDSTLIERFRLELMVGRLRPKSVNNCTDLLRLILNRGVKWRILKVSPYDLKPLKIPENPYEWWEQEEDIQQFLSYAKQTRYYALYKMALETGVRLGELIGLNKNDVDLTNRRITIHQQWLDKEKCLGPTKGNNIRSIPINRELAIQLAKSIEESPHSTAVFVTRTGKRVLARKVSGDHFQRLIKKAGIPRITFHGMRHTFASHYMINGGTIWDLKQTLGHADVRTTQDTYAHHSPQYLDPSIVNWSKEITQQSLNRPKLIAL